ncbi:MAG TPA: hypothetical protein VIW23_02220 [Candidatus Acidoferrum sp.]|jgi:hypothetical protein
MKVKKFDVGDWLGEALDPVLGQKLSRFTYRKASKRRGRRFDTLELVFPNGKVLISPDPVEKELELVVSFQPSK